MKDIKMSFLTIAELVALVLRYGANSLEVTNGNMAWVSTGLGKLFVGYVKSTADIVDAMSEVHSAENIAETYKAFQHGACIAGRCK